MTSQVILEDFRGSGTLNDTPVVLTGVSGGAFVVWGTYTGYSSVASAVGSNFFQRSGSGATVDAPAAPSTFRVARLDTNYDMLHSSGVTVFEASVLPDFAFRVYLDLTDSFLHIESSVSGDGRWMYDQSGSTSDGTFTGSAPGALVVLRIELTSTATRYYVDDVLKYTHGAGFSYGLDVGPFLLGISRTLASHSYTTGDPLTALNYMHVVTETVSGPLGGPDASPQGSATAAGPLGSAEVLAYASPVAQAAAPSPLGAARLMGEHDFTDILEAAGATEFYVCDIVDGPATVRVPISSWQGTIQLDGAGYLQVVIPAVADLAATINALTDEAEFIIYRCARLPDGTVVANEMARSLVEQVQLDQGPRRYTCTVSGYPDAAFFSTDEDVQPLRVLRGVRSLSTGTSGARARCDIDWFLRPGGTALAGAVTLAADYINFYAAGRDSYMDVGERI